MTLIDNWKQAWKYTSVQLAVLLAVANGLVGALPQLANDLPGWLYVFINTALCAGIAVLRVIKQDVSTQAP